VPLAEIPLERGHKEGYPTLRNRYFTTIRSSSVKTAADRRITSTADELSGGTNIDDLERPSTPKIWVLSEFFAIFSCDAD